MLVITVLRKHVSDDRKIYYCRHQRMNMGKHFEYIALEHPCRFVVV